MWTIWPGMALSLDPKSQSHVTAKVHIRERCLGHLQLKLYDSYG
jgi:hypothetical protein